jgi:hypothetical protein
VVDRLLAIAESGGIRDFGLDLKIAAVQALAAIGDARSLPKLNKILFSGRLLHPAKHIQLKIAIIKVLPKFQASLSRPILEDVAAKGGRALLPAASEALRALPGGEP